MVGDSNGGLDGGVICNEDLAEGVYIDIYLLTGITNLSVVTYDSWAVPQSEDFEVPYDSEDFQGCWHETITLVMDSQEFHVPKRLASARLPYVKTYLGSAFAHGPGRIELGIDAPAKALDSLLGIIMGGRQYFEDWWDNNDYGGSLELIKVADFLGCTEMVQIIEDLLIKELQMDQSVEESLMVIYSSGFPSLQRLKCACLHTAAFEVLVRLCPNLSALKRNRTNGSQWRHFTESHTTCESHESSTHFGFDTKFWHIWISNGWSIEDDSHSSKTNFHKDTMRECLGTV